MGCIKNSPDDRESGDVEMGFGWHWIQRISDSASQRENLSALLEFALVGNFGGQEGNDFIHQGEAVF